MKSRLLAQRIIDPAHGFLILTRAEIRQCACEFVDVAERVQRTQPDRTIAGFDRDRRTSVAPKGLDQGLGPPQAWAELGLSTRARSSAESAIVRSKVAIANPYAAIQSASGSLAPNSIAILPRRIPSASSGPAGRTQP